MRDGWIKSTIVDVCSLVTDGSHFSPKSVANGRYMVSVKDFTSYGFDFTNCRQIGEEDYVALEKSGCVPEIGDILIGKDGARYFEDIIIYRQEERPALLSSIAILRCNKLVILPEYLYYLMITPSFKQDVRDNYGSGSAIPRIILKDFKRMPISYPPLAEQRAIAATLSCLDDKIELNNKINANLEAQAQAIFKSWFVDFEPWGGVMPEGWRVGTIADFVVEMKNGGTPSRKNEDYWNSRDIPWIKTGEILNQPIITCEEYISKSGFKNSSAKLLPINSVLIALYGATAAKLALLRFKATTNQACCAMICSSANSAIYLYLNLLDRQEYIKSLSVGSAQQNLSKDTIATLSLIIPPSEIVKQLPYDLIYNAIEKNISQNRALAAIRDALLPKLMSGEIEVPVEDM